MWSLLPIAEMLRSAARRPPRNLAAEAKRSWTIAPATAAISPRAVFLPGQLERVTDWAFATGHPRRQMEGGYETVHAATRANLLENAFLIDGALYRGMACAHLQPRSRRMPPRLEVREEIERGAVYCTPGGNRYFGQWLMDDCATYPLARAEGTPVTTIDVPWPHRPAYEERLGMAPRRCGAAFLREAVIFEDVGQNQSKHERFRGMHQRLADSAASKPHPGVFIIRGTTGDRRLLRNEAELAQRLGSSRGLRILDPAKEDVATIVATCAGARLVVGVEGSGLIHGILGLGEGGAVLTLQAPNRFVGLYKDLTDRDHQHFAFVVGEPAGEDFRVDADEVERTIDLLPAP